jgi:uncharacterized protein YkwD
MAVRESIAAFALMVIACVPGISLAASESYAASVLNLLSHPPAAMRFRAPLEVDLLRRLNDLRLTKRLNVLRDRPQLKLAARAHSLRMLRDDFFAHKDPSRGEVGHRVAAVDRVGLYRTVGENLAQISPALPDLGPRMRRGWVQSPGHYRNMINRDFDHVGIACVRYRDTTACTQVFGGLTAELAEPVPLVIKKGQSVRFQPKFAGLTYDGWQLVDMRGRTRAHSATHHFQPPLGLYGDFQVQVLGAKRVTKRRQIISNFFGPTVILE